MREHKSAEVEPTYGITGVSSSWLLEQCNDTNFCLP
jgi:hypothetical protein